jgi:hypothetical protein
MASSSLFSLPLITKSFETSRGQSSKRVFCKHCGQQFSHVKDWSLKTLLAPPLGVYKKVTVKFMQLRGYCEDCDVTSVAEAEWIHQRFDNMTCGFAEVAGRLMEETTCEAVSRILHTDSKLMWRLDQHRMEVMLQFLKLPKNLDLTYLAADEVHFRSALLHMTHLPDRFIP